ncbi:MAG: hypothetical protein J5666_04755, partial [Bacilli bacterium]|nr:hypothetical protein [Bacilli bacterium]
STSFNINSPLNLYFVDYYLAGDFNNSFGNTYSDTSMTNEYMLKESSTQSGSYEVTFTVEEKPGCTFLKEGEICFNFRKGIGDDWSDYFGTLTTNDKILIHNQEIVPGEYEINQIFIKGVKEGDVITFMIHPNNRSYSYSIK